jgi:hypothetical protein
MKKTFFCALLFLGCNAVFSQIQIIPYAYYSFSGNAKDSVGTKNGKVYGATLTTDRFGAANSAYNFDGVDDHIDFPSDFDLEQRTYDLWFRLDNKTTFPQTILACDHPALINGLSNMEIDKYSLNTVQVGMALGSSFGIQAVNQGVWYRCTMSTDGSTDKFYINGILIYSGNHTDAKSADGVTFARVGASRLGIKNFKGVIDDIRIYDVALTQAEISALTGVGNVEEVAADIAYNPNSNSLQIDISKMDAKGLSLSVFDMNGKEVIARELLSEKNEIEMPSLPAGVYISVVRTPSGTQKAFKFTKR